VLSGILMPAMVVLMAGFLTETPLWR